VGRSAQASSAQAQIPRLGSRTRDARAPTGRRGIRRHAPAMPRRTGLGEILGTVHVPESGRGQQVRRLQLGGVLSPTIFRHEFLPCIHLTTGYLRDIAAPCETWRTVRNQACCTTAGNTNRQRGRIRVRSVLGNAKSNCHRKMYPVERGGTGRKYMFLLGETWRVRACQESAEALVALTPGESRDERRTEESREDHSPARIRRARRRPTRSRRCNCGSYRGGGPSPSGWIPAPGEARGGRVLRVPNPGARRGPMGVHHRGRSRA